MKCVRMLLCLSALVLFVGHGFIKWDSAFKFLSQVPVIGLVIGYNFLPSDYRSPRIDVPLSKERADVRFSIKYKGRHEVDIVGCNVNPWNQSMLGLKMTVMDAKGKTLYHSVISNEVALLSFDEHGERYMRFCYAVLDVPKDLPADAPLSFSFSCFGNYEAFRQSNPEARIVLRKVIDK